MDINQGSRKAILLVLLVFVLGIALGAVGAYVVTTRPHAARSQAGRNPANVMAMFARELNLSPDQQKQIEAILNQTRARYDEIHKQGVPEYDKARDSSREQVRQILTPEQKPKFEELLHRIDAEHQKRQSEGH
jgi:Spy/CpxP family protein refolding chaperone